MGCSLKWASEHDEDVSLAEEKVKKSVYLQCLVHVGKMLDLQVKEQERTCTEIKTKLNSFISDHHVAESDVIKIINESREADIQLSAKVKAWHTFSSMFAQEFEKETGVRIYKAGLNDLI